MVASRSALLLTFTLGFLSLTGCRICNDFEDEAYPTYGGVWQRTDRFQGRVGSLFDPAGAKVERDSSALSEEAMGYGEPPEGEREDEDEFEALPPGRHPDEDRFLPGEEPSEEGPPNGSDEVELEEVRLQQPLGDPGTYTDF